MLTADLVDARVKDGEVVLRKLDTKSMAEALELAELHLAAAREYVGKRREELDLAWDEAGRIARKPKLAAAIRKLVEDACAFEAEEDIEAVVLRRALFTRASEVRRVSADDEAFDRDAVVEEVAQSLGKTAAFVERALFADLRSEHLLCRAPTQDPASIVEAYEVGRAQAVLLRAVRVTCEIRDASPGILRAFFAKLKFHKLLFFAEQHDDHAFRIVIDGPYSMFDAVTRYGLRLALLLPALRALDSWTLEADVRWGHERTARVFRQASPARKRASSPTVPEVASEGDLHLADDVRTLLADVRALGSRFTVRPAATFLDVPGLGVCVPDLVFESEVGDPIYVEMMGFWSRDAVFRRVELAQRGLGARIVFAASSRLRVSEALLEDEESASLYVYKGKPSARALLERVTRIAKGP